MGRNEHVVSMVLGRLEDPGHVVDGAIFGDAGADRSPVDAVLAQHVVLRVDKDDRGVDSANLERVASGARRGVLAGRGCCGG
jgi:hypothetical protein